MATTSKATKTEAPRTRQNLRVEYTDGTAARLNPNRPALLIAFELEHGVQQPQTHAQIAWIAWHGLGRPDGDLTAWLARVEAIEPEAVTAGKASS